MKKILTFILALVFTFNIGNTFSQEDTMLYLSNDEHVDTSIMIKPYSWINMDSLIYIYDADNVFYFDDMINDNAFTVYITFGGTNDTIIFKNDTIKLNNIDIDLYDINLSQYIELNYLDASEFKEFTFDRQEIDTIQILITLMGPGNGLVFNHTIIIDNDNTLNIEEHNKVKVTDINVYPNPVINSVTVDFETDEQNMSVELYSMNGQLLEANNDNRSFGRNSVQIEMYGYPKGMYLIKVGEAVRKVVK